MKKKVLFCTLALLLLASVVQAVGPTPQTATWDREADTRIAGYYVYWRVPATPVNPWVNTQRSAMVPQAQAGQASVSYDLTALNAPGSVEIAVTATDGKTLESGVSNIVPFAPLFAPPPNLRIP
jgi:hypothetical protein